MTDENQMKGLTVGRLAKQAEFGIEPFVSLFVRD